MKALKRLLEKRKRFEREVFIDEKTTLFLFEKVIRREFGEVGSIRMKPKKLIKDKIITSIDNSNWAAELFMRKGYICGEINKEAGKNVVQDIIIENN